MTAHDNIKDEAFNDRLSKCCQDLVEFCAVNDVNISLTIDAPTKQDPGACKSWIFMTKGAVPSIFYDLKELFANKKDHT